LEKLGKTLGVVGKPMMDGKPLMSEISWKQFHNFKTLQWGGSGEILNFE
jgi:hypothetical protein